MNESHNFNILLTFKENKISENNLESFYVESFYNIVENKRINFNVSLVTIFKSQAPSINIEGIPNNNKDSKSGEDDSKPKEEPSFLKKYVSFQ